MEDRVPVAETPKPVLVHRQRRKKRGGLLWGVLALVLVVAAVAFAIWAATAGTRTATAKYSTAQVTKDTIVVTVSASGNMVVNDSQSVTPQVSGTVKHLYVKLGQKVRAGDILYTITNRDLSQSATKALASLRNAEQSVQRAKISRDQAEQTLDNLESATGTRAPTQTDLDIAQDQVDAAKTGVRAAEDDYDAAQQAYDAAQSDLSARTVRAPMDGTITTLSLTEGGSASASGSSGSSNGSSSSGNGQSSSGSNSSSSGSSSSSSLVISDLNSLIARVQVNEVDLPSVKVGQKASITFDAISGLQLSGKITQVALTGTSSSGVVTYDVDIKPSSLDRRVKPNMSTSAAITTNVRPDVLAVPNAAVKSDTNGSYVQVLGADGTAQRVTVTAGAASDTMTEITDGLTLGQSVVTADLSAAGSSASSSSRGGGGLGGGGAFFGGGGGGVRVRGN